MTAPVECGVLQRTFDLRQLLGAATHRLELRLQGVVERRQRVRLHAMFARQIIQCAKALLGGVKALRV